MSLTLQVPKSNATFLKDEVEVFMYNKLLPMMQEFADLKTRSDKESIQMPIPIGKKSWHSWYLLPIRKFRLKLFSLVAFGVNLVCL